jgi:hypothetical protein
MTEVIDRARLVRWSIVVLGLFAAAAAFSQAADGTASARAQETQPIATASQAEDDDVILPSRVSAAIERSLAALDRAEARVDDHQYGSAAASLVAVGADLGRADRAGQAQLAAPMDPEAESTSGPDSVIAVLTLDQSAITRLAGLYATVTDPVVLNRIGSSLNVALAKRNRMLNAVIALDPEGAGVAYADAMADTLDGYTDEVANLTEALKVDRLTTSARSALTNALSRSQAAAAKVTAAYGGGE